jgi:hypothetical protein
MRTTRLAGPIVWLLKELGQQSCAVPEGFYYFVGSRDGVSEGETRRRSSPTGSSGGVDRREVGPRQGPGIVAAPDVRGKPDRVYIHLAR